MAAGAVGRETELTILDRWLSVLAGGSTTLLIEGEAGIGKTTLLRRATAAADGRGYHVLATQPTTAEARLSFAALWDLLDPVVDDVLEAFPDPQRLALEVALLRRTSGTRTPDPRTVGAAVVGCLRLLADRGPVVVAVDDVQWIDAASARTLSFALRRLGPAPVGALLARRGTPGRPGPLDLERAPQPGGFHRLAVEPLGATPVRALLEEQLQWTPARATLARVQEVSGGNPLFALELGRALQSRGDPAPGDPLSVPERLRDLVLARLRRIPSAEREVLLHAAALRHPTLELLRRATDSGVSAADAVERAEAAGVAKARGGRVTFVHPLFSSVLYGSVRGSRRRAVHRRLAAVVQDPEERARHEALASDGPDAAVAAALEEAARLARGRGAADVAAELADMAHQHTPAEDEAAARRRRVLAADHHTEAGAPHTAARLLEEVIASDPPIEMRAGAIRRLAEIAFRERGPAAARVLLEQALDALGPGDSIEHARIHTLLSIRVLTEGQDLPELAARHAALAVDLARRHRDADVESEATAYLAVSTFIAGRGLDRELLALAPSLDSGLPTRQWPGVLLMMAGDLDPSRDWLDSLRRQLDELGDETLLPETLYWLTELEWRAGRWEASRAHAHEAWRLAGEGGQGLFRAFVSPYLAATAAAAGRLEEARAVAEQGVRESEAFGHVASLMLNRWALGFTRLCAGDSAEAARTLKPLWAITEERGYRDPGVFQFHGDLIEALVAVGELEAARAILEELEERGRATSRPYARVAGHRCRALLASARGEAEAALAAGDRSIALLADLPMPFERARTYLVHGTMLRRVRRRRDARDALQRAADGFRALGAPPWVAQAEAEIARLGLRTSQVDGLTPMEERVADMAASGQTNQQIAQGLTVSVRTVEATSRASIASSASSAGRISSARALRPTACSRPRRADLPAPCTAAAAFAGPGGHRESRGAGRGARSGSTPAGGLR